MNGGPTARRGGALLLALLLVALAGAAVAGFALRDWLPPLASSHGAGVDRTIRYILAATGAIFILGHLTLAFCVWRFREGGAGGYRPVGPRAEWLWALGPVALMTVVSEVGVLWIGMPVWAEVYGEPPAGALEVEVVGKQFEWLVRYPGKDGVPGRTDPRMVHDARNPLGLDRGDPAARDDVVLRGELHLDAGRDTVVRLRSHDVLHSFSLPLLRVKQDVVPGLAIPTRFRPTREGSFEIACAELCGLGHYRMRGTAVVHPAGEFEAWLAAQPGWFE
ncbi:MAG: cytochrome-c oxidase [Planctomycetes bacterium]|nr:cytochrome-c oxidase [Planctomycetota bacterium]